MKLYELSADFNSVMSFDPETEGDAQALVELLDEVEGKFADKAASICGLLANWQAESDALKIECDRMNKRSKTIQGKCDSLKNYLETNMKACQFKEMQAGTFALKFVKNPPSVSILGPVAAEWLKPPVEPEPDKRKIADALKSGIVVENAALVQTERLSIK